MSPELPISITTLFYREAERAWQVGPHTHPVHQWFFCLHGRLTVSAGGADFALTPEHSVIIPPNVERQLHGGTRSPGYVVAIFACPVLNLDSLCLRALPMPSELRTDVQALVAELRAPGAIAGPLLQATLLLRLLIGHLRAATPGRTADSERTAKSTLSGMNSARHEDIAASVERFLCAQLHRTLTRAEVAAVVRLSEPQLARVFRAATGRTVMERLTELRLARAKELLLEPDASVSHVAGAVGFASFSHFARLFRRHVGVPPSDYRRGRGTVWE